MCLLPRPIVVCLVCILPLSCSDGRLTETPSIEDACPSPPDSVTYTHAGLDSVWDPRVELFPAEHGYDTLIWDRWSNTNEAWAVYAKLTSDGRMLTPLAVVPNWPDGVIEVVSNEEGLFGVARGRGVQIWSKSNNTLHELSAVQEPASWIAWAPDRRRWYVLWFEGSVCYSRFLDEFGASVPDSTTRLFELETSVSGEVEHVLSELVWSQGHFYAMMSQQTKAQDDTQQLPFVTHTFSIELLDIDIGEAASTPFVSRTTIASLDSAGPVDRAGYCLGCAHSVMHEFAVSDQGHFAVLWTSQTTRDTRAPFYEHDFVTTLTVLRTDGSSIDVVLPEDEKLIEAAIGFNAQGSELALSLGFGAYYHWSPNHVSGYRIDPNDPAPMDWDVTYVSSSAKRLLHDDCHYLAGSLGSLDFLE